MIEKMTRYDFVLLSSGKDGFIDALSALGVMDITRSARPVDEHSAGLLSRIEAVDANISRISKGTDEHLKELELSLRSLQNEAESAARWGDFDRAKLDALGLPVRFYCIPEKKFDPAWEELYAIAETARERGKVWFVVIGEADIPAEPLPVPSKTFTEYEREIAGQEAAVNEYKDKLESLKSTLPELKADVARLRRDDALIVTQHRRNDGGIGLRAAHEEKDFGSGRLARGTDLLLRALAIGVHAVSGQLFEIGFHEPLQDPRMRSFGIVTGKGNHSNAKIRKKGDLKRVALYNVSR